MDPAAIAAGVSSIPEVIICLTGSCGLPARIKPPREGASQGAPPAEKAPGLAEPGKAADRTTCWLICRCCNLSGCQDIAAWVRGGPFSVWYAVLPIKVGRQGLASRRPSPNSPPRCDFASVEANKEGSGRLGFPVTRLALLSLVLGGTRGLRWLGRGWGRFCLSSAPKKKKEGKGLP